MKAPLKETVYSPKSDLLTPGKLFVSMFEDAGHARELAWRLLVRNISAQYRQSLLGYAWAFVPPLFTTLIWVFLQSQRVFNVSDTGMPYPVFVLTGTVLWQTFTESLNCPLQMVNQNRSMLTKINFPREALIMAGVGQVIFGFLIRALLLVAVMWWYGAGYQATILLAPLGVLSLILLGTTIGLILTPLGMLYHDVGRALSFATQALFFLTPIIYPVPTRAWAAALVQINPVTPLLQTTREWLITGETSLLPSFLIVTGASLIFLLLAWILYRVSMPHLISRMSS